MISLLTEKDISYIRKNIDKFKSNTDFANKFNLTRKQFADLLYRNKIRRTYTNQGKVQYNENFFSRYSHLSCYWAGFIMADGCISYRKNKDIKFLTINLQEKDRNHLNFFKSHIEAKNLSIISRRVRIKNNLFTYNSIILYNNKICEDLEKFFGIRYKKELRENTLGLIPDKYKTDFIRGLIDADGSISVYLDKSLVFCLSLSGNPILLNEVAKFINLPHTLFLKKDNFAILRFSCHNSIKAFQDIYLKKDAFSLNRKKEKYFKFISKMTLNQKTRMKNKGIFID